MEIRDATPGWRCGLRTGSPVRLGHQVFVNGRLAAETMDAAVKAFVSFRDQMDALEIRHLRAVATSAVREARNGALLVERIHRDSGIRLEIITGSEEARLVHLAVGSRIDLTGGQWIMADLGGGSVEVSLVDDSGMLWTESHTMGSVRLLEELSSVDQNPGQFQRLLQEYVAVLRIPAPARYWEPSGFIATGGNIEALAKLTAAQPDDRGVSSVPIDDLQSAIELLSRLSYRDRMERLDLREDRADVILPAGMVYLRLAELCGAKTILVPHVGVKEGIHWAGPSSGPALSPPRIAVHRARSHVPVPLDPPAQSPWDADYTDSDGPPTDALWPLALLPCSHQLETILRGWKIEGERTGVLL